MAAMRTCILGQMARNPFTVGITGRELLKPVVGFRIVCAGGYLAAIENISATAAASTDYHCSRGRFVFLLANDEFVTEVVYSVVGDCVAGIRFVTNLQVSQWFGTRRGDVVNYSSGSSCIHSICYNTKHGCVSGLGTVVWERGTHDLSTSESMEQRDRPIIKADISLLGLAFRSVVSDARGVVVTLGCGDHVGSIDVLSQTEVEHFGALLGSVSLPLNEHMMEIFAGEQLIGVELSYTAHTVEAIRFETTRRTTPRVGNAEAGSAKSSTLFRCEADKSICGFFASPTDSIGFGVVTRDRVTG